MCLGVPGQVLEVRSDALGTPMGRVSFAGVAREVCLAYVPEATTGDWVLVHAGFAIQRLDEAEAASIFEALEELEAAERAVDAERREHRSGETPS